MKFDKYMPCERLKPYVKQLVVSESPEAQVYKVFPGTSMVIGFQYRGQLASINNSTETSLSSAGITGIVDSVRIFKNSPGIGTVLVYFNETGFAFFSSSPAHELFNQSLSLDTIFDKSRISETEEKLALAKTDKQRVNLVEQFLLTQLREIKNDSLILEAVKLIYHSGGNIRIRDLNEKLHISQSPFEKRFRKLVGTSPKKFASVVRFNTVMNDIGKTRSLTEICYEHNFFDQAHFIRDFKKFTGQTPESFKTGL